MGRHDVRRGRPDISIAEAAPKSDPHRYIQYTEPGALLQGLPAFITSLLIPMRQLPTYNGYTVDVRLREFRRVTPEWEIEFIPFESEEGERLIRDLNFLAFCCIGSDTELFGVGQ